MVAVRVDVGEGVCVEVAEAVKVAVAVNVADGVTVGVLVGLGVTVIDAKRLGASWLSGAKRGKARLFKSALQLIGGLYPSRATIST